MSWMIKAEDISKMYRLGTIGVGTLQDDIKKIWYQIQGKDNPFLKIGEENRRDATGGEHVWALNNINFEVEQGEVLGIIGKNGAGKSTLLKLLSKVTKPTTGSIKTRGRIASLLEVGTGFHPELTGRENIFLNGAILGMKKDEIKAKFDEIVAFSGCERYIDTPVKRYSSGMYVRLAFAVAAHLEPEILVVDEVLAVGDAQFQAKAIGKMKDISKGQGRTVLFVSHSMNSIQELCSKVMVLKNGTIDYFGDTKTGIDRYLDRNITFAPEDLEIVPRNDNFGDEICFSSLVILNSKKESTHELNFYESFSLHMGIKNKTESNRYQLVVGISDSNYDRLVTYQSEEYRIDGHGSTSNFLSLNDLNLTPGKYYITLGLKKDKTPLDHLEFIQSFEIKDLREIEVNNKLDYLGKIAHKHIKWN